MPGFNDMPGLGSFVPSMPELAVPDMGLSSAFAEDTRVPMAKAIPTPKKTKPPPRLGDRRSKENWGDE